MLAELDTLPLCSSPIIYARLELVLFWEGTLHILRKHAKTTPPTGRKN